MRRWQAYYDILFFPLLAIFVASILMGWSGLILNGNFQTLITIDNAFVIKMAEMVRYLSSVIINNFPFLILIKFLSKRYEDSAPVFIGVIAYLVFYVTVLFFESSTLPSVVYSSTLGIGVDVSTLKVAGSGMRYPIITGVLATLVTYFITRMTYHSSRKKSNYGFLAFVNKDAWSLMLACVFTFIAGVLVAFAWPYVVKGMYLLFNLIAHDITNPINLFIYGIADRIMTMLGTGSIIRKLFWFSEFGGSWIYNNVNYLGDVSIWTAQQAVGIYNTGFGRLITPYYILNLFAVPALILGTYSTFTDKLEKRKYLLFLILALLTSALTGTLFPIELYLIIMTPLLYGFHLFMTGVIFALMQALNVAFGYAYVGSVLTATPGSAIDILVHLRNAVYYVPLVKFIVVGLAVFIIYYFMTLYYYRRLSMDILNTGSKAKHIEDFVVSIGGLENIRKIYSTPTKIILQVDDPSLLNFQSMQKLGASKVVETRTTYDISFGAISYQIVAEVNNRLKERSKS